MSHIAAFSHDVISLNFLLDLACTIFSLFVFFFFKQKTAYEMIWYWSSDVCSSDLPATASIGSLGIGSGSAISPNSASGPYREIQSEACSQARVPGDTGYRSASMLQPR